MKKPIKIKKKIKNFLVKLFFSKSFYSFYLFLDPIINFKKKTRKGKQTKLFLFFFDQNNTSEFKITSQNNEDGIIEKIFKSVPNKKYFIEIGFSYYECNSLNLIKNGWSGRMIDINKNESSALKKILMYYYPSSNVDVVNAKVKKSNINQLILVEKNKNIDFLSIDIDSNDFWILKEIDLSNVSVVCCEYNHWLGRDKKITIPYNEDFISLDDGIWGASLLLLTELLNSKGFSLIAVESSGTNAFFVKTKYASAFKILSPYTSFKSIGRFFNEDKKKEIFANIKKNSNLLTYF